MVNTLRYKKMCEIAEDAIRDYSESMYCAGWLTGVEWEVLNLVQNKDSFCEEYFNEYELAAMHDLIRDKLWVKNTDEGIVLSRIPQYKEGAD